MMLCGAYFSSQIYKSITSVYTLVYGSYNRLRHKQIIIERFKPDGDEKALEQKS